jgi:predicted GNAT superfamily acetyltransferase
MKNLEKVITRKGKRFLLKIETSPDSDDYAKYEAMRNEIWGFPEDNLPGTRNLMCENFLHDGSALFIAVYSEQPDGKLDEDPAHFVGFSYGFVGIKDKDIAFRSPENLQFYSQYTGLKEEFRDYGLGIAVKEFQRENVADVFGIYTITCTYDPLTGVNAWRNVHHFGMEVVEYRVSTYGEYGGLLNRSDVPSDRFFMSWDLRKEIRRSAKPYDSPLLEERLVIEAEENIVIGRNGSIQLEVVISADLEKEEESLFVQIPRDFYIMLKETDVEEANVRRIPLQWRLETRQAFQAYFQRGYQIIDFFQTKDEAKRSFYVLRRREGQEKERRKR